MDVAFRADRVISRIRTINGNVAIFSTGYFLRVLIARWLGLDPSAGRYFKLGTAVLSVLSRDRYGAVFVPDRNIAPPFLMRQPAMSAILELHVSGHHFSIAARSRSPSAAL